MIFADEMTIDGATRRRTNDGYLVAEARPARAGIQVYHASEMGRMGGGMIRVYRPADQVFAKDSLASFAGKPITDDHPSEGVNSKNWSNLARGFVGSEIARDGEVVRVPLLITDAAMIDKIESGKVQLSAGYACEIEWKDGVTPQGEAYDAVQKNIRINHVALVDAGRAGAACRVLDSGKSSQPKGNRKMADALKTITVDGIPVEVTDQAAAVIKKLEDKANTLVADLAKKDGELAASKATHDASAKDAADKIAALEKQIADDASGLEARIEERAAVIDAASKIAGKAVEAKGKTVADIRREVVEAKLGDAAKGKDVAFIDGAFATLSASIAVKDALQSQMTGSGSNLPPIKITADQAYAKHVAELSTMHLPKGAH